MMMDEPSTTNVTRYAGSRILVVDDDAEQLRVHSALLEAAGYRVDARSDPREAMAAAVGGNHAAMLVDLAMPHLDGLALVAAARQHDPELCCVILTARASIRSAREAMRLGAFDYLEKPFDLQHVVLVLDNGLEQRRLRADRLRAERALADSVVSVTGLNHELARSRRRAEQLSHAKTAFIAELSVELRVPLTTIRGFSQVLAAQEQEPGSERARFLSHIVSASSHMLALLDRISSLGMAEWAVRGPVDAVGLAHAVTALLEGSAEAGGVALACVCPPELVLDTDESQLRHALLSLLSRAIASRQAGGRVTLALRPNGATASIEVSDEGPPQPRPWASTGLHLPGAAVQVAALGAELAEREDAGGVTVRSFMLPMARAPQAG